MKDRVKQLVLGATIGMLAASPAQGAIINFGGIEMETSGSASLDLGADDLILTPASNNQVGGVYSTNRFALAPDDDFTTEFSFNIDRNGADGMAFVMQPLSSTTLGGTGTSLGVEGVSPSFAIALDTFDNAFGEGTNLNMVRAYTNGDFNANSQINDAPGLRQNLSFALDDNVEHFARLNYTGASDTLDVFVSETGTFGPTPTLSVNVDLNALMSGEAHFGFTAATGGFNAEHRVTAWTAPTLSQVVPTPPSLSGILISPNGSATSVSDDLLRLTTAFGQAGSAFALTPVAIDNDRSFTSEFTFQLSGGNGPGGADGVTFVIQNDPDGTVALGGGGNGLGINGIDPSLAIAFDTFDPVNGIGSSLNILRILENGVTDGPDANGIDDLAGVRQTLPFELNNGDEYFTRIVYDGVVDLLQVFLTDDLNLGFGSALLERMIDLEALLGTEGFVGFTGATGGFSNVQDILAWSLITDPLNVPEPLTVLLLALGLLAVVVHKSRSKRQ